MLDLAGQRGDDDVGDFIQDGEDVVEFAVVALGPQALAGRRIDELHGHQCGRNLSRIPRGSDLCGRDCDLHPIRGQPTAIRAA